MKMTPKAAKPAVASQLKQLINPVTRTPENIAYNVAWVNLLGFGHVVFAKRGGHKRSLTKIIQDQSLRGELAIGLK